MAGQSPRQGVAKREKGGVGALRSRGQCLLETSTWPEGAAGPGVRLLSWLVQCPEAGRDRAGATRARGDVTFTPQVCSLPGILRWGQCPGTRMGIEAREDAGALRAISAQLQCAQCRPLLPSQQLGGLRLAWEEGPPGLQQKPGRP